MEENYSSAHELQQLALGIPIHAVIKVRPSPSYSREDLKIHRDRVALLDVNNRVREEYDCSDAYDGGAPLYKLFEEVFPHYIRAVIEGVNIAVLGFGTSGSGKSYNIEGEGSDAGLLSLFVKALFENLEEKRYRLNQGRAQNHGFNFSVKMRYVEVIDEEIHDLLVQTNSKIQGTLQVINDEWEGATVLNASWVSCTSAHQLLDMFVLGRRNRSQTVTDFGPLSERAASITTLEVLQVAQNSNSNEANALVSRITFVDLPGMERLQEDPESLRIKEGNSLNKSIIALGEVIAQLAENPGTYIRYDGSVLTHLLTDIIGGNSLTMALFCLRNGDLPGTILALNYMKQVRQIINYPVVNDSKQVGLLRRYRKEINHLANLITSLGTGNLDSFGNQLFDLEKQLIDENLEKLKFLDEKTQLSARIKEIKEGYNKLIKEKTELQEELIKSEEERLHIGKALIELQIQNAQLQQENAHSTFNVDSKLLHAEKEVLAANMKEEKAIQAINEMQERFKKALEEKRDIETEFVALKTNYLTISQELEDEKRKNENLSIEIINLVNANKSITNDTDYLSKLKSSLSNDHEKLNLEKQRLQKQIRELEDALLTAKAENEGLKSEMVKYTIQADQQTTDYQQKKNDLDKNFIEVTQKIGKDAKQESESAHKKLRRLEEQQQQKQSELVAITRQLKITQRKVAELEDSLNEFEKNNIELDSVCKRQRAQLEELTETLRGKLFKALNSGAINENVLRTAREELFRNYNEQETELKERLTKEEATNAHSVKVIRGLRAYARGLKSLAEDWAPLGQPKPDLLTMPPPILLEDEDANITQKAQRQEMERLKLRNENLEHELKVLQTTLVSNTDPRRDTEYTRKSPHSRPISRNEVEHLQQERAMLREENRKLISENKELKTLNSVGPGRGQLKSLQTENEKLIAKVKALERDKVTDDFTGTSENPKTLQMRLKQYQEMLRKLEKERSELIGRATMAEEQLKNFQEHMQTSTVNYNKKIAELQQMLQSGGGRNGRNLPKLDR